MTPPPTCRAIVLFGDSLTQNGTGAPRNLTKIAMENEQKVSEASAHDIGPGWADLLAERYARRLDVVNRGLGGYNTRWALEFELPPRQPVPYIEACELATIWFGANDAADLERMYFLQHVPVADYRANLVELVARARKSARRVLLMTPPPVMKEAYVAWRLKMPENAGKTSQQVEDRRTELVAPYRDAVLEVAKEEGVPVCDVFNEISRLDGESQKGLYSDGLHFSSKGDALVFQTLTRVIAAHWPELEVLPDSITGAYNNSASRARGLDPPRHPFWDKIDKLHPARTFTESVEAGGDDDADEEDIRPKRFYRDGRPLALFLGDSLTQNGFAGSLGGAGWLDLFSALYSRRIDVINRGLSGYNTRWALAGWSDVWTPMDSEVELFVVFFGANDAVKETEGQHVPVAEYERNMRELIRRAKHELLAKRIVVVSPPPVFTPKYVEWRRSRARTPDADLEDRSTARVRAYVEAARRAAKLENDECFVDLCAAFESQEDMGELFSDGLHLSNQGQALLFRAVRSAAEKRWPELAVALDPATYASTGGGSKCRGFRPNRPWFRDLAQRERLRLDRSKKPGPALKKPAPSEPEVGRPKRRKGTL